MLSAGTTARVQAAHRVLEVEPGCILRKRRYNLRAQYEVHYLHKIGIVLGRADDPALQRGRFGSGHIVVAHVDGCELVVEGVLPADFPEYWESTKRCSTEVAHEIKLMCGWVGPKRYILPHPGAQMLFTIDRRSRGRIEDRDMKDLQERAA